MATTWLRRHPIFAYMVLACGFSWCFAYVGYRGDEALPRSIVVVSHYLAKFGPSLAGVAIVALLYGRDGTRTLFGSLLRLRVGLRWYVVAIAGPLVVWACTVAILAWQGHALGPIEWTAIPIIVLFVLRHFFLGGGLGEELGWRGFMLPRLQERCSALTAAIVVGFAWGFWHWPRFFWDDQGGWTSVVLFTIYTIVLSVVFTWLFNGSGGNLFIVTLFHAMISATNGYVEALFIGLSDVDNRAVMVGLVWLAVAVLLVVISGPRRLARTGAVSAHVMESGAV